METSFGQTSVPSYSPHTSQPPQTYQSQLAAITSDKSRLLADSRLSGGEPSM